MTVFLDSLGTFLRPRARKLDEPYILILGVQVYTPQLPVFAIYAGIALVIGLFISWVGLLPQQVISFVSLGIATAGLAISMGVSPEKHPKQAIAFVIWLASVIVLATRMSSGS